jgi:hypothetical protein
MKPNLGLSYPPDWRGTPMQMSHEDRILWIRWSSSYPQGYQAFYYSVLVGDAILGKDEPDEELQRMIDQVSRRRLDVVGEKKDSWEIIELRPNAGPGAIGSVLTYKTLWEQDPIDERKISMSIVTDNMDRNLKYVCEKFEITVYLV